VFLQQQYGWAELVFTPLLMRFWCLEYYKAFERPREAADARVSRWQDACLAHPAGGIAPGHLGRQQRSLLRMRPWVGVAIRRFSLIFRSVCGPVHVHDGWL